MLLVFQMNHKLYILIFSGYSCSQINLLKPLYSENLIIVLQVLVPAHYMVYNMVLASQYICHWAIYVRLESLPMYEQIQQYFQLHFVLKYKVSSKKSTSLVKTLSQYRFWLINKAPYVVYSALYYRQNHLGIVQ